MESTIKFLILIFGCFSFEIVHAHYCFACDQKYPYIETIAHDVCNSKQVYSQLINITCNNMTQEDTNRGAKHACFKIERTTTRYVNETYVYDRGCATKGGAVDFCADKRKKEAEIECFLCDENNCNDANDMQIIRCLMFFLAVLIVLYMRDQAERNHMRDSSRHIKW
ncbi:hypothetical protein ACKWTF_005675 [Chironomus riparius]